MCGFERGGEQNDVLNAPGDPLQRGCDCLGGSDPDEKDGVHANEAFVKGFGTSQVSIDGVDVGRQTGGIGIPHERADLQLGGRQLGKNMAADVSGCASDKDSLHGVRLYRTASL